MLYCTISLLRNIFITDALWYWEKTEKLKKDDHLNFNLLQQGHLMPNSLRLLFFIQKLRIQYHIDEMYLKWLMK